MDIEFAVDTMDSVGLPGLIGTDGGRSWTLVGNRCGKGLPRSLPTGLSEVFEPLIVASRRRRSSNGAAPAVGSKLVERANSILSDTRREVDS